MKQRIILALLIVFAGFASCSDSEVEVVQAPTISGIEATYSLIEGAKLELIPAIENGSNAIYSWLLNDKEVAKTKSYVFEEITPGKYHLVLKVGNDGGVAKFTITIAVEAKNFTFEGITNSLIALDLPNYVHESGYHKWEVLDAPSELYRFSQAPIEAATPLFIAAIPGKYSLQLTAGDLTSVITIIVTASEKAHSPYFANAFDYLPAPGQFVNKMPEYKEGDSHEDMVAKVATALVGENARMITLGGWGGYVTMGFDHTIVNVAGRKDFRIEGNGFANSSEPGIVMVSYDVNGNGKPDDEWYEIKGSANFTAENEDWYQLALDNGNDVKTYRDYEMIYHRPKVETADPLKDYIFWTNNKGKEGYKEKNTFHKQSYYPLWVKDETITFNGVRLAESGIDESGAGSYFVLKGFKYGYVDNHPNRDNGSTFDIDWAVNKEGAKVNLPGINFVKVYTGVDQENGWIGENSTEVARGTDLHVKGEIIDTIKE